MGENNYLGDAAVIARIVLTGRLVLKSPLCIGDGSGENNQGNDKDIHIQKNKSGKPFIPGTSMCGVLRCFVDEEMNNNSELLFGSDDAQGSQSLVQIYDIVLENSNQTYRDGVAIHDYTGVAKTGAKYDYEIVDHGEGDFRLEAVIRQKQEAGKDNIREDIIRIKDKLEAGIRLGAMTAKGMGLVQLKKAKLGLYDLKNNKDDVKAWFMKPEAVPSDASDRMKDQLEKLPGTQVPLFEGDFELRSTMIIRTDNMDISENGNKHIDKVFLRNSAGQYVVPGTSIKGVLRHRARYILDRLCHGQDEAVDKFINNLMGHSENIDSRQKSRFYVSESTLTDAVQEKIITRNRIDRITGGVMDSALFTTVPVYQEKTGEKALHIKFFIKPAKGEQDNSAEIGLALLLFRDLWQGRIAIGGETGVGRGTLKGLSGRIVIDDVEYTVNANGEISADNGDIKELDKFVQSLAGEVQ
ncbi:MAG: hypothetical protein K6C05_08375 [Anaerovibrio sp.]|uniref:RAMP superfamily CRISPR-associated protein n=1 Tax=Anaerovibrio sp. TaxID=1872532 RepID=UPI0025DA7D9A|nr:RAMP superfamily CRISPR-associated protein [Anaerovibrio sp.]MCR5176852.1 hypothetical protein [Anaerovibrio sp.]